jgi:hypothetical protein
MDSLALNQRVCKAPKCSNALNKGSGRGFCRKCYRRLPDVRAKENATRRKNRMLTNDAATKKYEKTKKGFLMRLYRNMQSRIEGVQKKKHHLYKGLSLLERELFYEWALNSKEFHKLFDEWELQEYPRKLSPSVDRVNSDLGYFISNMEWVTHSENSRRGSISKARRKNNLKQVA